MERSLLLQIVDMTWKDHLLAMDHLRSSVAFVGYAQVDPKVEYKREGMKLFEQMWDVIERETSDLIFKMESLDEGFVSSTWKETSAVHAEATSATEELGRSQDQTSAASQQEYKVETIRNRGHRVGRNDPCPCGSGKKYKNCHMKGGGLGRDVA
jgi:preprotein translocase subunit SecA